MAQYASSDRWRHKLVLGFGGYGKSTLLRTMIRNAQAQGRDALILDPNLDDWGVSPDNVTVDADEFMWRAKRSRNALLIVDEAGEMLNRDRSYRWIITRSRHNGHLAVLSSHMATDIIPVMRRMPQELFIFQQDIDSAAEIARERGDPLFLQCPKLGIGQYVHKIMPHPARIQFINPRKIA
jgi:hypothetical protein